VTTRLSAYLLLVLVGFAFEPVDIGFFGIAPPFIFPVGVFGSAPSIPTMAFDIGI